MGLFSKRQDSQRAILPAWIIDDLQRIGRESCSPPWYAERYNDYVMPVTMAKQERGAFSSDSAGKAFLEDFLTELMAAAEDRGDDAIIGAFMIADDWGDPESPNVPGFPAFAQRAGELLRAAGYPRGMRRWF